MQNNAANTPDSISTRNVPISTVSRLKSVIGVASGNALEMYDFMIFGYYAKWIARAFFPLQNEVNSLLLTLATFGAGFLMRPLGAVLLGGYTDRHGRRAGLLLTLSLMAIGTATIALTPSYSTIGLAASLIVVTGRLLQGLSAGAELGAASVYLSEIAPEGLRGLYVSFQSASQQVSVMGAAVMGIVLVKCLPEEAIGRWGWRLPLLVGCALIPFLFWIRQSMTETRPVSVGSRRLSGREVLGSLVADWRIILIATLFTTLTTTAFYFITVYTLTFGVTELRLASKDALTVTLFVGLLNVVVLPVMGRISDRVGRRGLLWSASLLFLVSAYPTMLWLVAAPSFARLLTVELWFAFLYASYNAAMVVYLTEFMPPKVRATSFALAYSTATALFGGFTPFVCTYVIKETGNKAAPGLWLSFAALIAVCAVASTYLRRSLVSRSSYSWNSVF
ncbi:tricarballylate/proton symporter TcuC [Granulicella arctica]|uniref:MFS family permease n=1 Tax=Granulicella arctica TaxID=940613 RepID=A0A7Y9THK7_9BACT|nr:tricarballylate/proton symporter TcuC [Granulicella arctica]NYF80649.1 MFS family permease [Granulicella arctica]